MYRIALVNPVARRNQGYHTIGQYIPMLGLQVLARLAPPDVHIDIIDEIFGPECTNERLRRGNYDLVGLTGFTSGATRAYEIARQCREEGLPLVYGGPHASACPAEAMPHVDSVAIGECDDIWPGIIADARAGRLQRVYQATKLPEINRPGVGWGDQSKQPINGQYGIHCIQTSRGCPVGCEYCSVTKFNGPNIRRRLINDIVAEWNSVPKGKFIFVVDDNFFGVGPKHAIWAKQLLQHLAVRGNDHLWFSQTTINMGDDPQGLRLAYRAGCRGMLVGFETFNDANLKEYHKGINRKNMARYQELVNTFHRHGVSLFGGFIVGADEDTIDTVATTVNQALALGIDIVQITNLTPLPGTKQYDRYVREGRLFHTNFPEDWEKYTFTETVFAPRKMTAAELDQSIVEVRHLAAEENWVWKRTLKTFLRTRSFTTAMFVLGMNIGWKRMAKNQQPIDLERYGYRPTWNERMQLIRDSLGVTCIRRDLPKRRTQPAGTSTGGGNGVASQPASVPAPAPAAAAARSVSTATAAGLVLA